MKFCTWVQNHYAQVDNEILKFCVANREIQCIQFKKEIIMPSSNFAETSASVNKTSRPHLEKFRESQSPSRADEY